MQYKIILKEAFKAALFGGAIYLGSEAFHSHTAKEIQNEWKLNPERSEFLAHRLNKSAGFFAGLSVFCMGLAFQKGRSQGHEERARAILANGRKIWDLKDIDWKRSIEAIRRDEFGTENPEIVTAFAVYGPGVFFEGDDIKKQRFPSTTMICYRGKRKSELAYMSTESIRENPDITFEVMPSDAFCDNYVDLDGKDMNFISPLRGVVQVPRDYQETYGLKL